MLAVYEQEAQRRNAEIEARDRRRADSPRAGSRRGSTRRSRLGFEPRPRAAHPGARAPKARALQAEFPDEFATILAGAVDPLDRAAARRSRMPTRRATRGRSTRSRGSSSRRSCGRARSTRAAARAHVLAVLPPGARASAVAMDLPPVDAEYFDAEYETMPRPQLEALQDELLLEMLPHAYEHAPLDPRDVGRRRRAPARHPNARRLPRAGAVHRQGRGAPLPRRARRSVRRTAVRRPGELTGGDARRRARPATRRSCPSSGAAGGGTADDHHARLLGHGACGPATTSRSCCSRSAARPTACSRARSARRRSSSTSTPPRWSGSASSRSSTGRPAVYNFGSVLINAVQDVCDRRGFDPHDVFSSYKGVMFAGEPLAPACARARRELGRRAVRARQRRRRDRRRSSARSTTACTSGRTPCSSRARSRRRSTPIADGERCELVATSLVNRIAPLIRYRSDDIVRLTREPCALRAHARADVADRPQERRGRRRRPAGAADRRVGRGRDGRRVRDGPVPGRSGPPRGRRAAAARRVRGRRGRARVDAVRDDVRGRGARGDRRRARRRARARTTRCCGSVRRTRSRGWRRDDRDRRRRRVVGRRLLRRRATAASPWEISHDEIERDIGARRDVLGELGVARASACCAARCSPRPASSGRTSCGTMLAGAQLSCADATEGEAVRVAMFLRLMRLRRGVRRDRRASSTASTQLGTPYADVFARRRDRRRAPERVRAAGGRRAARRTTSCCAVRRSRSAASPARPRVVDGDEWELDVDATAASRVTNLRPRATAVRAHADRGARHDRRRRHRSRAPEGGVA